MALSTLLATPFMKPFSSTISLARSASYLHPSAVTISPLITASDSDSDYSEAPIPKAEEVEDGVDGAVSDEDMDDEEEGSRKYFGSIPIPEGEYYKMEQIDAQTRNGVLKMVIPKVKLEEREDLISVIVDN